MIKVSVIDKDGLSEIETYPDIDTAIHDIHTTWMETTGFECYLFQNEQRDVLAIMLRYHRDPELCITTYNTGHMDVHRCRYMLDDDGQYEYAEIEMMETRRLDCYNPPIGP